LYIFKLLENRLVTPAVFAAGVWRGRMLSCGPIVNRSRTRWKAGPQPEDKLFYRDGEQYLTMEELTRRIMDKALFPKLGE
jgi:hypothetical protein